MSEETILKNLLESDWIVEMGCCFEMYIGIPINVGTCNAEIKYVLGWYFGSVICSLKI